MKKNVIVCALCLLLQLLPVVAQEVVQEIQPEIIPFKQIDSTVLTLHVFRPVEKSEQPLPAIVFFFGSGWVQGSVGHLYSQSRYLAERGMIAICAEYRIKDVHGTTPYECVADGKSAMRWVRAHAAELGIDPNKLAAGGASSGGHVACCAAMVSGFNESTDDMSVSPVPAALVLFNPVLDTSEKGYGHEKCGDRWQEISPAHLVTPGLPPTIIFHGTADSIVPFENAERFARLMQEKQNNCTLYPYADVSHGFFNSGMHDAVYYHDTVEKMNEFLVELGYLEKK